MTTSTRTTQEVPEPDAIRLAPLAYDARVTVTRTQRWVLVVAGGVACIAVLAALFGFVGGLVVLVALISTLYLADLVFAAYLVTRPARESSQAADGLSGLDDWPTRVLTIPAATRRG
jgi:hypothetical protein